MKFFGSSNGMEVGISDYNKINIGISEFLGTSVMLFVSCMGCVPGIRNQEVLNQQSALSSGLACLISIFVSILDRKTQRKQRKSFSCLATYLELTLIPFLLFVP